MTIPTFPEEGGGKTIHTLVIDAGGSLTPVLFAACASDTVDGERIGPMAAGGFVPDGEANTVPPLPIAGMYDSSPSARDSGDVVTLLVDAYGRALVVGAVAENTLAAGNPVLVGGRYDVPARTLDNGDAGALAIDVAGRAQIVGAAAEDGAATGNPVLIGGRYDATPRTLEDGDAGAAAIDSAGRLIVSAATIPTVYNVTLIDANAEYSQALPTGCRAVAFRCRDPYATIRFAWEPGKVAGKISPYQTLGAGGEYWKENVYLIGATLYFASSKAGVTVEIEAWS